MHKILVKLPFNQRTHGQVWSWTVAPCQRSGEGCEWFDSYQTRVGEESSHFHLKLNSLWFYVTQKQKI